MFRISCIVSHDKLGYDVNGISTVEQPPRKKSKVINAILEKQIEIQNNEYFTIYDKLKGFNERSGDCQSILKSNNQFVPGDFAEVRFQ